MARNDTDSRLFDGFFVPIAFRCLESGRAAIEYTTRAIRIFQNGYVISSPRRLRIGSLVSLRLSMPLEFRAENLREMRCAARVIAEESISNTSMGYMVQFDPSTLPM